MIVQQARARARQWVTEQGSMTPGFWGAFYHGSVTWLPDEAVLPATSDVDVVIVLADADRPPKLGKLTYRDVLLDVSYLSRDEVQSAEVILGQSHMAGSFRAMGIIADPSGQLTTLQAAVARAYAGRRWVYQRCAHARDKILNNLDQVDQGAPFHDQVMLWLFATGVTTHVLLVAGLRNPTVRRRYMAAHDLLADYGRLDFYTTLLEMLGCAQMTRTRAEQHLAALTAAFDAARAVITTPFPFAADISELARPIAIDGSRELIERGYHREAIFWLVVTYSRCQKVLTQDGPIGLWETFGPGYRRLMADLGVSSFADLQRRGDQLKAFLPRVWEVAEAIIAANPEIKVEV